MEKAESLEATKIPHIDRQQLSDTVGIHTRRQPGVMDLHAMNVVGDQRYGNTQDDKSGIRTGAAKNI
jgi:hypothetical protein